MSISKILIVGAGPSGLLLAILLAKDGINVELLEMTHELDKNPRASHYADSSMHEFERAGILDEIREQGFMPDGVSWRKLNEAKTRLVASPGVWQKDSAPEEDKDADRYRMVCLPLHRLGVILERAVKAQPTATISYGHKVVDQGESDGKAWVRIETANGEKTLEADYVIGCDGANSKVRRLLFGDSGFPGMTWDEQIVATNVYYDFSPYDYDDSQFFVHPDHYHMVAKIQSDGMYRITYGEIGGLTTEQLRERQPGKFATFLPGHPGPKDYKIVNFSPYKVHQRCVDKMRVGRFLLAADAAHLCNPFGGMGLTGGIADIGSLYEALTGIHAGLADDTILDTYDEVRRKIWHEIINPISTENLRRLIDLDPETAVEQDPVFRILKQIEEDIRNGKAPPAQTTTDTMRLRYDMTPHYKK